MARKRVTVDDWLKEEMRDEEFRLLWSEREAAYRVARELIRLRKQQGGCRRAKSHGAPG